MKVLEEKKNRKNIKDTFFWSCLELLIIPFILVILSVHLDKSIDKREQRKIEYLTSVTEIVYKITEKDKDQKLEKIPILQNLVRAKTISVLNEVDNKSKREIVRFLANLDLQYQISLSQANLQNVDLNGLYLKDADLSKANLRGTNLENAILEGVNLDDLTYDDLKDTNLKGISYDTCTKFADEQLKNRLAKEFKWEKVIPRDKSDCRHTKEIKKST